ncbi:MAG: hypothetical protein Q9Q13_09070, partial [Acidobacteriota bacterium]|nr:hypothetical protein [Acidobacteriota bacterium]
MVTQRVKWGGQGFVDRVADAPAGHRPGLGNPVGDDRTLEHPLFVDDGSELSVVDQARVDLVGIDPDLGMAAQDLGDGGQIPARENASRRIVRGIENQQPRLVGDPLLQFGGIEGEISPLAQVQGHPHGTHGADLGVVDREARIGIDHFVARPEIGHTEDRVTDEGLGSGTHHH